MFTGAWRRSRKHGRHVKARVISVEAQNFRFSRAVDEEAFMVARVLRTRSGSQNLRRRVDDFPKTTEARGGAWQGFGRPYFWVFLTGGRGARLWCRFRQAKA